ncbi:hypothetical protein ACTXT7_009398 [Hymenolepis weldensis]
MSVTGPYASLSIVSRGLAHILAFLDRNEPEIIQPPPPLPKRTLQIQQEDLQEQQSFLSTKDDTLQYPSSWTSNQEEEGNIDGTELSEDDPYETGVIFEEDYTNHEYEQVTESDQYGKLMSHSRTSSSFSLIESRPSSAMAAVYSQFSNVSSNLEWSESERHLFRKLHDQPEFYEHIVMATESGHNSTLSLTSFSDDENDNLTNGNLELSQSYNSWSLRNNNHQNSLHSSYRDNLHMPESLTLLFMRGFTLEYVSFK